MNRYYTINFAQAYGESTYGACTYNDTTSCATSGGGSSSGSGNGTGTSTGASSGSGGTLTNTGIMVIGFVAVACLIIFAALVVRIWRRGARRKVALQEASSDNDDAISRE